MDWVETESGCREWQGYISPAGYGFLSEGKKNIRAHRRAYEEAFGPIPDGLVIDHLCRNRACVNPAHLEAVSTGENTRRGHTGLHMREKSKQIAACPQGHEYTTENTRIDKAGARVCRTCDRERCRSYRRRLAIERGETA